MGSMRRPARAGRSTPARPSGRGRRSSGDVNELGRVKRLAIIGGGAWGTALAVVARRAGSNAVLWARDGNVVAAINERHENPLFLPGIALDPAIVATSDIDAAVARAEAALLVVPAQFLRGVIIALRPGLPEGMPVLHCAKGIEAGSLKTMSEISTDLLPNSPFAVLSGPTFAAEVGPDSTANGELGRSSVD